MIEKKRGIRKGTLEDLMSGRIRLQGFTADWVVYPFSKYFSLLSTNTCSRDQLSDRGQVGDIHYGDVLIKYGDVLSDADEIPRLKDISRIKERSFLKMLDVLISEKQYKWGKFQFRLLADCTRLPAVLIMKLLKDSWVTI